jgi:hypothetical protein
MKTLARICLVCSLAALAQATVINPNFELDQNGNLNLADRPFSDCLGWDGWGPDTYVVQDDAWGDAHPAARMAARIGPDPDNSVWQNTGIVAQADTVYILSADTKSEFAMTVRLGFESVDGGVWTGDRVYDDFTAMHHLDWRTYTTTLDTALHPSYVGLEIGIGIVNRDWNWGRTYATNVQMEVIPEPTTLCLLALGVLLAKRRRNR